MLPVVNRLTKRSDFELLRREGKTTHTKLLRLRYRPNHQLSSRVAIVVSLHVSKQATKRNRAKRRMAAVLRKLYPALLPGFDIAIYPSAAAIEVAIGELETVATQALKRTRLIA